MAPVLNILTAALSFSLLVARTSVAAPVAHHALTVRQLAGEGAACDSVLSSTDNGVGYGVENAEDNTAGTVSGAKGSVPARRQLAGEGAACNSILSSTDNGVGYGVENAEDNTANTISGTTGGAGGAAPGAPAPAPAPTPAPGPGRRQLDKIANGAGTLIGATGAPGGAGGVVSGTGDSVDGTLTSGAANAGAQVGSTEEGTLEGAGAAVPKL